jgi:hypothetical protein
MKEYPEIKYYGDYWGLPIMAFVKLDGSNLRFEYSQKRGFYKFGTRNVLIDRNNDPFGFAIDLFLNKYDRSLTEIFKSKTYRNTLSFVCYAEVKGKKSEFGQHDFKDDEFEITLFDVEEYKKGLIPPRQFYKDFHGIVPFAIPNIIYEGNLNRDFVMQVKNNTFNLQEGVVCKGRIPNKKDNNLYYCKIKTDDWFERLRVRRPDLYLTETKQLFKESGEEK